MFGKTILLTGEELMNQVGNNKASENNSDVNKKS